MREEISAGGVVVFGNAIAFKNITEIACRGKVESEKPLNKLL